MGMQKRMNKQNRKNSNNNKVQVTPIDNPYKNWKLLTREDITLDVEVPKLPEKPNLMTENEKNIIIEEIDTKIITFKNERDSLNNKLSEIAQKLKRQKPDYIVKAENERKEKIEIKKKHLDQLNKLKFQKKEIRDKMSSFDDQKPDKMKRSNLGINIPKDEDELNRMIEHWENVLQTKSLKTKEEEDILKKLNQLETMRKSITD